MPPSPPGARAPGGIASDILSEIPAFIQSLMLLREQQAQRAFQQAQLALGTRQEDRLAATGEQADVRAGERIELERAGQAAEEAERRGAAERREAERATDEASAAAFNRAATAIRAGRQPNPSDLSLLTPNDRRDLDMESRIATTRLEGAAEGDAAEMRRFQLQEVESEALSMLAQGRSLEETLSRLQTARSSMWPGLTDQHLRSALAGANATLSQRDATTRLEVERFRALQMHEEADRLARTIPPVRSGLLDSTPTSPPPGTPPPAVAAENLLPGIIRGERTIEEQIENARTHLGTDYANELERVLRGLLEERTRSPGQARPGGSSVPTAPPGASPAAAPPRRSIENPDSVRRTIEQELLEKYGPLTRSAPSPAPVSLAPPTALAAPPPPGLELAAPSPLAPQLPAFAQNMASQVPQIPLALLESLLGGAHALPPLR